MVRDDLAGRGIRDAAVLAAMGRVRREAFVLAEMTELAYDDCALPIEEDQTISQPYIVAAMAEAAELGPEDRVLEIGTGSGYGAAVLAAVAAEVWTVERHDALAERAAATLAAEGVTNVHVRCADGSLGWPEAAPFDAIVVTAAAPAPPRALLDQLVDGGRLVIPVGPGSWDQELVRVRRTGDSTVTEDLGPVRFVPLIGSQGFAS
jgi:protein-L-isoaspartate(D-aspartate) O-methyltransferase